MTRKVCVVTGTRAEYGLLRWVMEGVRGTVGLQLQLIVTGMHLSEKHGFTYQEIEADGFTIDRKVEMMLASDTSVGIAKSIALGVLGITEALDQLQPDIVVLLGDRFEILSAATAAMSVRTPIAHLHGGERTEGVIDEAIRHAVSKMSHLHFVAAREYRDRIVQMGEQPERVFVVGGLGLDNIKKLSLLSRAELEVSLNFKLLGRNLLITFHPVTLEKSASKGQMAELLSVLASLDDTGLIFTMPNADPDSHILFSMIDDFVSKHANAASFASLGQLRYLSAIRHVDGVVGNSSSGLIEVPAFRKGTINIGDRQLGRLKAKSVIDCAPNRQSIADAIIHLYSSSFQEMLKTVENPYGEGGASDQVVKILASWPLDGLMQKRFFDLPALSA
jgi:GDP/UDP-N,N'-diacetylbacillosamine 2-epimerase (hydrolysing)